MPQTNQFQEKPQEQQILVKEKTGVMPKVVLGTGIFCAIVFLINFALLFNAGVMGLNQALMEEQKIVITAVSQINSNKINNLQLAPSDAPTIFDKSNLPSSIQFPPTSQVLNSQNNQVEGTLDNLDVVPEFLEGWPIINQFGNDQGIFPAPAIGDIDNDGYLEIVGVTYPGGDVYVWRYNGVLMDGWPQSAAPGIGGSAGLSIPALANLDNDPELEIVVANIAEDLNVGLDGAIRVWNLDGTLLPGWPQTIDGRADFMSPTVYDINADGIKEIILGIRTNVPSNQGKIYIWRPDGTMVDGWPVVINGEPRTSAIYDVDRDGMLEIFVSSWNNLLYGYNHDGTTLTNWPQPLNQYYVFNSPTIIRENQNISILISNWYNMYIFSPDGSSNIINESVPVVSDIIPSYINNSIKLTYGTFTTGEVVLRNMDGTIAPGNWPKSIVDINDPNILFQNYLGYANVYVLDSNPIIKDINNDGENEIIMAAPWIGKITALKSNGQEVSGFPIYLNSRIGHSMAIADLDRDRILELIVTTTEGDGGVYIYKLRGAGLLPHAPDGWEQFHSNAQHTGFYEYISP